MTVDRLVHDHFEIVPAQHAGAARRGLVPVAVLIAVAVGARRWLACRMGLIALSIAALRAPWKWEGFIVLVFKRGRGLTTTDLAGIAGLIAARRAFRFVKHRGPS